MKPKKAIKEIGKVLAKYFDDRETASDALQEIDLIVLEVERRKDFGLDFIKGFYEQG